MNDKQATSEYQKYKRSENAYGKFDTVISDQKEKKKKTSTIASRQSSNEMRGNETKPRVIKQKQKRKRKNSICFFRSIHHH